MPKEHSPAGGADAAREPERGPVDRALLSVAVDDGRPAARVEMVLRIAPQPVRRNASIVAAGHRQGVARARVAIRAMREAGDDVGTVAMFGLVVAAGREERRAMRAGSVGDACCGTSGREVIAVLPLHDALRARYESISLTAPRELTASHAPKPHAARPAPSAMHCEPGGSS